MQRTSISAATLFVLLTSQTAWSDVQYWISIGSYKSADNAQQAIYKADVQLHKSFSVIGIETSKGYYYRVAAGPYTNRQLVEDQVKTARINGFDDAWMWVGESGVFSSNLHTPLSEIDLELEEFERTYSDLDDLEDYLPLPAANPPGLERENIPELVKEAPASFKLNKLRRDASFWSPHQNQPANQLSYRWEIAPLSELFVVYTLSSVTA